MIISISPSSILAGTTGVALTVTGQNFASGSTVNWNGSPLTTSYTSSTTLTAQVPNLDTANPGSVSITVANSTGTASAAFSFTVTDLPAGVTMVPVAVNDMAWDPVNQQIYLAIPNNATTNANTIQPLNPLTGALGTAVSVGVEPKLLSVSATSKYLYVFDWGIPSQNVLPGLQRLKLPSLASDISIDLGVTKVELAPYYVEDMQSAPDSDATLAVVRYAKASFGIYPVSAGVLIFDNATPRAMGICGDEVTTNCEYPGVPWDKLAWGPDGSQLFGLSTEGTGDLLVASISSAGFGTVTDYYGPDLVSLQFDKTTKYVYDNGMRAVNPANGTVVGTFNANGLGVPFGSLGTLYVIGQTTSDKATGTYTLQAFNINTFALIGTLHFPILDGLPTKIIHWGPNGLAISTVGYNATYPTYHGAVYLINGGFVTHAGAVEGPVAEGSVGR